MNSPHKSLKSQNHDINFLSFIFDEFDVKGSTRSLIDKQTNQAFVFTNLFQQQFNELIKLSNQEIGIKKQLQNVLDQLLDFKNTVNSNIDKVIKTIIQQLQEIDILIQKFQTLIISENNQLTEFNNVLKEFQNQTQCDKFFRNQVKQQLEEFRENFNDFDNLLKLLNVEHQNNFIYELMPQSTIKDIEDCLSFVFNKEGNILITGQKAQIIVYEFYNGRIKHELQTLSKHSGNVCCLYFMKQSYSFISGSEDTSLIIWEFDEKKNWIPKTQLNHNGKVSCILMSKDEDLIISGSYDCTIKFWAKSNTWYSKNWSCLQTIDTKNFVYGISLNDQENKLVSCGSEAYIQVLIKENAKKWSLPQTIEVREFGFRLYFITNDQFIFQPETQDYFEVYNSDYLQKQFVKKKQIQVQSCEFCDQFPCQYIKDKQILTVKHGQFLNIFQVEDGCEYFLVQTIDFGDDVSFGRLTEDGKYLVTWDESSYELQVRKLNYLQ